MSCLLALVNRLKSQANYEMLTDSQKSAYIAIVEYWRFPSRINLHGPSGSGRTFLAWVMCKTQGATYHPSTEDLTNSNRDVSKRIIDNVPTTERDVRYLLAKIQLLGTYTSLVISDKPVGLGLTEVELPYPTPSDFDIVYHNLSLLEYYALEPVRRGNIWEALHAVCG